MSSDSQMLDVSVVRFADHHEHGKDFTLYEVVVGGNPSYSLHKRYREFEALWHGTKNLSHTLESFKFPNKSKLNTLSDFTKERRLRGFDEFLKLLVEITPRPSELETFLELDSVDSKFHSSISNSTTAQSSPGSLVDPGNVASAVAETSRVRQRTSFRSDVSSATQPVPPSTPPSGGGGSDSSSAGKAKFPPLAGRSLSPRLNSNIPRQDESPGDVTLRKLYGSYLPMVVAGVVLLCFLFLLMVLYKNFDKWILFALVSSAFVFRDFASKVGWDIWTSWHSNTRAAQ